MAGLWLASYLVLWALVLAICIFLVGTLRQLGLLQLQLDPAERVPAISDPSQDGPPIGSRIPNLVAETFNSFGTVLLPPQRRQGSILLMFMAPLCESCQLLVETLNALEDKTEPGVRPIVVMRADESTCRSFLSVFPLHVAAIGDHDGTIHKQFTVHRAPFGLLYDGEGTLTKKGIVHGETDLQELLGAGAVSMSAQNHVYPRTEPSNALA